MEGVEKQRKTYKKIADSYFNCYKRNPKLFKSIAESLSVFYTLLILVIPNLWTLGWLTTIILALIFIFVYFNQAFFNLSLLEDKTLKLNDEIEALQTQSQIFEEQLIKCQYDLNKISSEAIYSMNNNSTPRTVNEVCFSAIEKIVNLLETTLSSIYKIPISASIKLQNSPDHVETWCRGRNCQKSRQHLKRKRINVKHPWRNNFAFQHILECGNDYYSSEDLFADETFFCELEPAEWKKSFRSTAILPIRTEKHNGRRVRYEVLGLLCVDATQINPLWHPSLFDDSSGYCLIAMFCFNMFTLLDVRKKTRAILNRSSTKPK